MGQALSFGFAVVAAALLGACGNSSKSSAGPADSGPGADATEEAGDAGDEGGEGTYPAFTVDAPQIRKNQGAILAKPVLVTVSWPGDTNASTWEGFGDAIGASSYWSATTAQYGVSPVTSGPSNHVRMTQPLPPSLSYYDMENLVIATLQPAADGGVPDAGAPNPSWPAPTLDASGQSQTIYSLFIPSTTTETDPGTGTSFCGLGGFGYHDLVTVGSTSVVFSVTLECPGQTVADLEETAAHETVEAATNPNAGNPPLGYVGFDADHLAWDLYTGFNDELADACESWQDSYYEETGSFPYWVQRSWSNTAAAAGHDPCAPAAAGAYQGMTLFPSEESTVTVNATAIGGSMSSTRGFKATVGQPLTFQVGYFSDASAPPWKIAYDFPSALSDTMGGTLGNGKATVAIDKTTGQNGDKANVTVTVSAKGAAGFHLMAITWDPPTSKEYLPHYLPLVIVDE